MDYPIPDDLIVQIYGYLDYGTIVNTCTIFDRSTKKKLNKMLQLDKCNRLCNKYDMKEYDAINLVCAVNESLQKGNMIMTHYFTEKLGFILTF